MALTQDETVELRLQTYQRLLEASLVAGNADCRNADDRDADDRDADDRDADCPRGVGVCVCVALQAAVELDAQGRIPGLFSSSVEESVQLEPVLEPVLTLLLRRLGEMAAEAEKSGGFAAAAVSFCVTQMLRGWLVPLLEPKLPALMEVLLVFLRREPGECGAAEGCGDGDQVLRATVAGGLL